MPEKRKGDFVSARFAARAKPNKRKTRLLKTKGGVLLKRLAYFLRNMDQDTHTYPEMYDAELFVVDPERAAPDKCFDPIYYNEDIGFKITGTHKDEVR